MQNFIRILKTKTVFSFNLRNLWNLKYLVVLLDCHFNINQTSLKGDLNICSKNLIKDIKHYNKTFHRSASQEVKK